VEKQIHRSLLAQKPPIEDEKERVAAVSGTNLKYSA
jgi:hypothetical protein